VPSPPDLSASLPPNPGPSGPSIAPCPFHLSAHLSLGPDSRTSLSPNPGAPSPPPRQPGSIPSPPNASSRPAPQMRVRASVRPARAPGPRLHPEARRTVSERDDQGGSINYFNRLLPPRFTDFCTLPRIGATSRKAMSRRPCAIPSSLFPILNSPHVASSDSPFTSRIPILNTHHLLLFSAHLTSSDSHLISPLLILNSLRLFLFSTHLSFFAFTTHLTSFDSHLISPRLFLFSTHLIYSDSELISPSLVPNSPHLFLLSTHLTSLYSQLTSYLPVLTSPRLASSDSQLTSPLRPLVFSSTWTHACQS
jgi:hypothetical protein